MADEKKEIVITVKKAENGFILFQGERVFVAEQKYDLKNTFDRLIDEMTKKEETPDD